MTAPAVKTDPMQEFRARVLEKLRADIGSMLPDEALTGLVNEAVKEQFFTRIPTSFNYRGDPDAFKPSWFVQEVAKIGEPIISAHIEKWLKDSEAIIGEAVKKFVTDQNLLLLMMGAMRAASQNELHDLANAICQRIKQPY